MLRTLMRWTGYAMLAGAMALGVIDGARSISLSALELTPLSGAALWLLPRQFPLLEPTIRNLHAVLWDPVLATLFALPAIVVFFVLGGACMALGQNVDDSGFAAMSDELAGPR